MASEERIESVLGRIQDAVVQYDEESCRQWCRTVVEEGIDPCMAIVGGLNAGMRIVGEFYQKNRYFVPELLLCSDALYAGLEILKPHLRPDQVKVKGKIVIGTVEGDIHDIGKNLVKTMFEAAGWDVCDLGKDVKLERFLEEQQRTGADVVALSALMTTSMMAVPKVIGLLRNKAPRVKVLVGGAPFNESIAQQYGADGYASDAVAAVQEGAKLIGDKRSLGF